MDRFILISSELSSEFRSYYNIIDGCVSISYHQWVSVETMKPFWINWSEMYFEKNPIMYIPEA